MAIIGSGTNGFPSNVGAVLEQQNFLETKLRRGMKPKFVFRTAVTNANLEWFEARIGETKTFTRSAEMAPNITPLNPTNNSGLDNGITPGNRTFEQWKATLFEWADGLNINILGNEVLLADLFLDDIEKLGGKAANSIELVCGARIMGAYDSGDTFARVAITGTASTLSVDNTVGFDTQYLATLAPSLGLPQPVSNTNKLPILVLDGTTGAVKGTANVTGVAVDGTNLSYMQSGPLLCGTSGVLTLDAAIGPVAVGDRVVAMDPSASTTQFNATYKDGSYVVRPLVSGTTGAMVQDAYKMAVTNTFVASVQIPQAVALLKRRGVPKLKNGLYGCAIDSTLLAALYQDAGFIQATATRWDSSPVFTNGLIAAGWGVEFTDATQLPVYLAPAGGFNLRHALVFGEDVVAEHPFSAAKAAQSRAGRTGDMFDFRWVDRIEFITQAALDRLGEVIKLSYKFVGDFQCGTDKGSNPNIVLTTDWCRFKRGVIVQVASAI